MTAENTAFSMLYSGIATKSSVFSISRLEVGTRCLSISRSSLGETSALTHDYVIVGAGSAGCVLANRLSAQRPTTGKAPSVHLLEAGPTDRGLSRWTIKMPAALMYNLCHDKYNWFYHTVPQVHMNNRIMYWPRGRVLGGSSSLNAMVYIRGHPMDYDRWEREGAIGWNYANCLPYFRRSQAHELGPDEYRGGDGPLHVSRGKTNHPLHQAWLEAAQQAGHAFTEDVNGFRQVGDLFMRDQCISYVSYFLNCQ